MDYSLIKTYYQLTKPGIIYGNLMTATAGFLFASRWHFKAHSFLGMLIGLGLVIACGCVLNNLLDRSIDQKMERTKQRATVTGKISVNQALIYGGVLGLVGTIILGLFTNSLSLEVALIGLAFYVVVYGVAKRTTIYSTLIGAVAGAIPPLVGYAAASGGIDFGGIMIFLVLVCWQLTHFYAIALYRKDEYSAAKLPVWPVVKGDYSAQLNAIVFIALFTIFGLSLFFAGYTGYVYLLLDLALGLGWLWYSIVKAGRLNANQWGKDIFRSSLIVILLMSILLALGPVLP